jgi:hypothetical protein
VSDHMKTQTTITHHDAGHLAVEAVRVVNATDHDLQTQQVAISVWRIAQSLETLAERIPNDDVWQTPLAAGTFDDLLQAMRRTLERIDPRRKAVA